MSVLMMAFSIGVVAGPAIGSLGQVRDPFLYFAGAPFGLALCVFALLPRDAPPTTPVVAGSVAPALFRDGLRRELVCACLVILVTCATLGAIEILLPLQFSRLGWTRHHIGLFFSAGSGHADYPAAHRLVVGPARGDGNLSNSACLPRRS